MLCSALHKISNVDAWALHVPFCLLVSQLQSPADDAILAASYLMAAAAPSSPKEPGPPLAPAAVPDSNSSFSREHTALPTDAGLAGSWLRCGPTVSFSVLSLHCAALSASGPIAEAVAVSVSRTSAHLGRVKPASRPGSTTASLYALRDVPVAGHGLRLALAGVQASVATKWAPAAARMESGLPAGLEVALWRDLFDTSSADC